ncbi:TFIIB-type zinc ribbon-containing protein [Butyrivibrio sp. XBB1001]|uniref:TFIIB-type zinc ribbon-containing protein n=1 Tax=Butyrivibrio sp. XBB1001 TaxID=1280682 RepID=UPI00041BE490|nr:TFIIB-type zinc ribbon-containing protein [Butyrivibrio sp. XBB1001]
MKLVDVVCPRCGANLKIDTEHEKAFCEYCGAEVLIDDGIQHVKYENAEQAGYDFEKGRQRAQQEASEISSNDSESVKVTIKNQKNRHKKGKILLITIILAIIVAVVVVVFNKTSDDRAGSVDDEVNIEKSKMTDDKSTTKNNAKKESDSEIQLQETNEKVIDLAGLWVQENHEEHADSYMAATIREDGLMGVFFIVEGDNTPYTYWVGTYKNPTDDSKQYEWISDSTYAGNGIFASSDDTKKFIYDNEKITYTVTIQGMSNDITLVREDWDDSKIPESAFGSVKMETSGFESLEIKDSGWYVEYGCLMFYVTLYNPNKEIMVEFPSYRITARDENGALIDTMEHSLNKIYPESEVTFGSVAFLVDVTPATVDFEVIEPKEYNLKRITSGNEPKPLEVKNGAVRVNKVVGEIYNPNDNDIDQVRVLAICRNTSGEVIAIVDGYISNARAGENTPFALDCNLKEDVASTSFYAYDWGYTF